LQVARLAALAYARLCPSPPSRRLGSANPPDRKTPRPIGWPSALYNPAASLTQSEPPGRPERAQKLQNVAALAGRGEAIVILI
jgi:hypothetical protein